MESDWKAFRRLVPEVRERYLNKVNAELSELLQNPDLSATEQFWKIQEKTEEQANVLRSCLDGHSRSKMRMFMALMSRNGMLEDRDLDVFTEELRKRMQGLIEGNL